MSIDLVASLKKRILEVLPAPAGEHELDRFHDYLRDYPQRGGKYIRSQLLVLSCLAHGGRLEDALDVGVGLELFQNWVLIHDDIEDDSEERRGKPALHRLISMPLALNVGDALHVYMWQLLHNISHFQLAQHRQVIQEFSQMILRTAEGQHLDLTWTQQGQFAISEADYIEMVTLKTAYYTVLCPLRLGALCAGKVFNENLKQAALDLGVAFQIRDDVLNLLPSASYGKEFAGDLYEAKRTLILAHTFSHATVDERQLLLQHLSLPRQSKTSEHIEAILAFIERYGSLAHAQNVAEQFAKTALEQFIEKFSTLPQQTYAQQIINIMQSLANRHY